MNREVYLDNSATTRPYDEVIDYISEINRNMYGNPSSLHSKGIESEKLIKKARSAIAESISADPSEIIFTSGGTESNNLAIRGYLSANKRKGSHIITSKIEHPSVLEVFKHMEENGYRVDYINVDRYGNLDTEELKEKISDETALVSILYVNNESGAIQPIEEISGIIKSANKNTVFHVDAVQAYGKILISPKKLGIDMMSLSSHKIHGPKGAGALYVEKSIKIKPIIFGGGQESLLRSGTENVTGICGFGLASEIIFKNIENNYKKVELLRKTVIKELKSNFNDCIINSEDSSIPYILNVAFPYLKSEVLLHHLEEKGIYVSTGSACSSRKKVHSHVLKAMGLNSQQIDGAIRISFSAMNKEEDIKELIQALKEIVPKITIKSGGRR